MLHKYVGDRSREHFGENGAPHTVDVYGLDLSRTKRYTFNSLGFRGEEFDPHARYHIFVCGSSHALGVGLNIEETWAHHFKLLFAKEMGRPARDVNLMNFAQGGSSNDYIGRTALTQCGAVKPTLLIAQFVYKNRAEGMLDGAPFSIGAWMWHRGWLRRRLESLKAPKQLRRVIAERLRHVDCYYRHYSDELGLLNTLRNMLLVQCFCRARQIDCLISWSEHRHLQEPRFSENPILAPLFELIDHQSFCSVAVDDPTIKVDLAADGFHPGPQSQQRFAVELMDFSRAHQRQGDPIRDRAAMS